MSTDDDLSHHMSGSTDPSEPPNPLNALGSLDPFAALGPSGAFDAAGEPGTLILPHALAAPEATPEQSSPHVRQRKRRGLCLYTFAGAAAIVVLLCAGVGVVALRATLASASTPRGTATNEASRMAILARTATGTATALPGATFAPLPNAVIAFGGGATSTTSELCNGPAPLDPVTLVLDNSRSTISVDWWIQITDTTPDGKLLWASGVPPYGTLRAGQSTVAELDPDPTICTQLLNASSPVTYHATVFYGGVSGFTISVVVMPPSPGQQVTSTGATSA
jgi:hypothetical protein